MIHRVRGALMALVMASVLSPAAFGQRRPTVAVMPAEYSHADLESARNVTQALVERFGSQGYTVVPTERAQATFRSMGLDPTRGYADRMALRFGRSLGADLVAYPRLLAVGPPASRPVGGDSGERVSAVLLLRMLNVHTGGAIYVRQVRHYF